MAPIKHTFEVAVLVDQFILLEHAVDPARDGDTGLAHHGGTGKAAFEPIEFHAPRFSKVFPRTFDQTVIARQ